MLGSARTKITFEDGGTMEIYHLDRQATETEVGCNSDRGDVLRLPV